MSVNREDVFTCNKCGHIFSDCKKNELVFCPDCKNIKRIQINNIDS